MGIYCEESLRLQVTLCTPETRQIWDSLSAQQKGDGTPFCWLLTPPPHLYKACIVLLFPSSSLLMALNYIFTTTTSV